MLRSEFNTLFAAQAAQAGLALEDLLPGIDGPQARLIEAMRYAALGGGKRLRPFLLTQSAAMLGYDTDGVWIAAAALECVHVYSLIHDDLPCMDDDDMRRGKPTVHKEFDEATAVLAGDALLTFAFELLAREAVHPDPQVRLRLISELAAASGTHGMIGGQMMDIASEGGDHGEAHITQLQDMKTGALIRYACRAGGLLAGASEQDLQNLSNYADALGLAFQIRDDILDAEGDADIMGKAAQKDAGLGKATFVSIYGLDGAKDTAKTLGGRAKAALADYGEAAKILQNTVDFVLYRQK